MAKRILYRNIIFFNKKINNRCTLRSGFMKIFGVGKVRSLRLVRMLGVSDNVGLVSFNRPDIKKINSLVSSTYSYLDNNLKRFLTDCINNKKFINSFQGFRHKLRLPVNGQRSRTNAKTQKRKKTLW